MAGRKEEFRSLAPTADGRLFQKGGFCEMVHPHKNGFFFFFPLNTHQEFPSGLLRPPPGSLHALRFRASVKRLQRSCVWADTHKNIYNCIDGHRSLQRLPFASSPQRLSNNPLFSCTIGLHIQIFFLQYFYPAKLKKYIMAACFVFVFFLFISKFTNKKVH